MLLDEKLLTVSAPLLSFTVGRVVPKFAPVIAIRCVVRLAVAL